MPFFPLSCCRAQPAVAESQRPAWKRNNEPALGLEEQRAGTRPGAGDSVEPPVCTAQHRISFLYEREISMFELIYVFLSRRAKTHAN